MVISSRVRSGLWLFQRIIRSETAALSQISATQSKGSRNFSSEAEAADAKVKVPLALYGCSGNYPSAVFIAASKANLLDKVESEILDIVTASKKSPLFSQFIKHLSVPRETRVKAIHEAFAEAGFSDVTRNFLAVLADNGQLRSIKRIAKKFVELTMAHKGEVNITVTTVIVAIVPRVPKGPLTPLIRGTCKFGNTTSRRGFCSVGSSFIDYELLPTKVRVYRTPATDRFNPFTLFPFLEAERIMTYPRDIVRSELLYALQCSSLEHIKTAFSTRQINSLNLLRIIDLCEWPTSCSGDYAMLTERCEGSLEAYVAKYYQEFLIAETDGLQDPSPKFTALISGLLKGLCDLHAYGLCHGNVEDQRITFVSLSRDDIPIPKLAYYWENPIVSGDAFQKAKNKDFAGVARFIRDVISKLDPLPNDHELITFIELLEDDTEKSVLELLDHHALWKPLNKCRFIFDCTNLYNLDTSICNQVDSAISNYFQNPGGWHGLVHPHPMGRIWFDVRRIPRLPCGFLKLHRYVYAHPDHQYTVNSLKGAYANVIVPASQYLRRFFPGILTLLVKHCKRLM